MNLKVISASRLTNTLMLQLQYRVLHADSGWYLFTGHDPQAATHRPCASPALQVGTGIRKDYSLINVPLSTLVVVRKTEQRQSQRHNHE